MSLAPDDPRHGTGTGYKNHGCRCEPCRAADSAYQTARRRAQGVPTRAEYNLTRQKHGWSRYRHGCKCEICRAAAAAQKRRQHSANIEHYRAVWREQNRRRRDRRAAA